MYHFKRNNNNKTGRTKLIGDLFILRSFIISIIIFLQIILLYLLYFRMILLFTHRITRGESLLNLPNNNFETFWWSPHMVLFWMKMTFPSRNENLFLPSPPILVYSSIESSILSKWFDRNSPLAIGHINHLISFKC